MSKSFFKGNGGTYSKVGDYFFPNLALAEEPEDPIGIWGQRREHIISQMVREQGRECPEVCK